MRRVLSEKRQNHNALYNYDSLGQKTCFQARLVFFFLFFFFFFFISFMYNKNSKGPKTDPCGTQMRQHSYLDTLAPTWVVWWVVFESFVSWTRTRTGNNCVDQYIFKTIARIWHFCVEGMLIIDGHVITIIIIIIIIIKALFRLEISISIIQRWSSWDVRLIKFIIVSFYITYFKDAKSCWDKTTKSRQFKNY